MLVVARLLQLNLIVAITVITPIAPIGGVNGFINANCTYFSIIAQINANYSTYAVSSVIAAYCNNIGPSGHYRWFVHY